MTYICCSVADLSDEIHLHVVTMFHPSPKQNGPNPVASLKSVVKAMLLQQALYALQCRIQQRKNKQVAVQLFILNN